MGEAPAKIMSVVILLFEVALVSSPNSKKKKQQV